MSRSETFLSKDFNVKSYVDELALQTCGNGLQKNVFPYEKLQAAFQEVLLDLQVMADVNEDKLADLQRIYVKRLESSLEKVRDLSQLTTSSLERLKDVHSNIESMSREVCKLGDQLEAVNVPRMRALNALKIIKELDRYMQEPPSAFSCASFTQLKDETKLIVTLKDVCKNLPNMQPACDRIDARYSEIQMYLEEHFCKNDGDFETQRQYSHLLSCFSSGTEFCVTHFVQKAFSTRLTNDDSYFTDLQDLADLFFIEAKAVFEDHDHVMSEFIVVVYTDKLKDLLSRKISRNNPSFLTQLQELHSRCTRLTNEFKSRRYVRDASLCIKLNDELWESYLVNYPELEMTHLKDYITDVMQRFYTSIGHKKSLQSERHSSAMLQSLLSKVAPKAESFQAVNMVSDELVVSPILNEAVICIKRCFQLMKTHDKAVIDLYSKIAEQVLSDILIEHVLYALEMEVKSMSLNDPVIVTPDFNFFRVVDKATNIVYNVNQHFNCYINPLLKTGENHSFLNSLNSKYFSDIERCIESGIDKCIGLIITYVEVLLLQNQIKLDNFQGCDCTSACKAVMEFVDHHVYKIKNTFDGKNVEKILFDFGKRLHSTLYNYCCQQQRLSIQGGLVLSRDMAAYDARFSNKFSNPLITSLFSSLKSLSKLVFIDSLKLPDCIHGSDLQSIDKSIIQQFLQLRSDYRSNKLEQYIV